VLQKIENAKIHAVSPYRLSQPNQGQIAAVNFKKPVF
jgi:hypothetical protein